MNALTTKTKLIELLAYPSQEETLIQSRYQELQSLGIQELFEAGTVRVRDLSILGKGYRGLVILATGIDLDHSPLPLALKVLRVDAGRSNFQAEVEALAIANQLEIGPQLYAHSEHFIAMEYLAGLTLPKWLQTQATEASVPRILGELLQQCFRLDQAGIDHGDLRCITEHVIFRGEMPVIIDFSGSSRDRRPANVTTMVQGFFWGTILPTMIANYYPIPQKDDLIPLLRQYKHQPNLDSFQDILTRLHLLKDRETHHS